MHATTVAIDLAKDVFQLAYTDAERSAIEPLRVTSRLRFAALFENRAPLRIGMEACGSAHYWGRRGLDPLPWTGGRLRFLMSSSLLSPDLGDQVQSSAGCGRSLWYRAA